MLLQYPLWDNLHGWLCIKKIQTTNKLLQYAVIEYMFSQSNKQMHQSKLKMITVYVINRSVSENTL